MQYSSFEKTIEDNKADYYIALRKSQLHRKTGAEDISPWLIFFFEILTKQMEKIREITDDKAVESILSVNQAKVLGMLDDSERITNKVVAEFIGINRNTAKQILNRLLKLKMIKRTGMGIINRYIKK
jgi:Fic family protein